MAFFLFFSFLVESVFFSQVVVLVFSFTTVNSGFSANIVDFHQKLSLVEAQRGVVVVGPPKEFSVGDAVSV